MKGELGSWAALATEVTVGGYSNPRLRAGWLQQGGGAAVAAVMMECIPACHSSSDILQKCVVPQSKPVDLLPVQTWLRGWREGGILEVGKGQKLGAARLTSVCARLALSD